MGRQATQRQSGIFSFGRSKARQYKADQPAVTFADVAGVDEAKAELEEEVDFLRHPQKYHDLGARIPRGILLVGAPSTGKTLLARAVAGEAGVPFFNISASEFVEMFVGVGASRVRDLFERAKAAAPAIVFILDRLVETLLKRETVKKEELADLLGPRAATQPQGSVPESRETPSVVLPAN